MEFTLYILFIVLLLVFIFTIKRENIIKKEHDLIHEYFEIFNEPFEARTSLINSWEQRALKSLNPNKRNLQLNKNESNVYYLEQSD
jgi:hypothetical protein